MSIQLDRARLAQIEAKYSTEQGATEAERLEAESLADRIYGAALIEAKNGVFHVSMMGQTLATVELDKTTAETLASVANIAARAVLEQPLYAAAPDLLAEAEAFVADFEAYINSDDYDLPDPAGLQAAIAKARGEAVEQ